MLVEHVAELAEVALGLAELRQLEQLALGPLDLVAPVPSVARVVGTVDHVLAERDQPALQRQVVDEVAVLDGVDDRLGGAGDGAEDSARRPAP